MQDLRSELGLAIIPDGDEFHAFQRVKQPVDTGTRHGDFLGNIHHTHGPVIRQGIEEIGAVHPRQRSLGEPPRIW